MLEPPAPITDPHRRRRVALIVALILLVSAGVRLWQVSTPAEMMFDEVYYAKDAKAIVDGRVGPEDADLRWEAGDEVSWPHPEIGKFSIAAGILVFGDRSFGWRFPAVVAGMIMLACVYPLARRLGLSPEWSLIALLLAAADTLGIAQSRIATLDVFVASWTVVCIWLALKYVQDGRGRRWLAFCALAGGLAVSTKWSGGLALLAAGLIIFAAWLAERSAARRALAAEGDPAATPAATAPGPRWFAAALPPLVALVAIPALVYLASYVQYFASGHTLADFRELHSQMRHFNMSLHAEHNYASIAPSWIIDFRPVWYYFAGTTEYRGVIAMGNPLLWWTATLALAATPVHALVRRSSSLLPACALVLLLWLPWFATTRTSFLYYMTPVAPFMAILATTLLRRFSGRELPPRRAWLPIGAGALATALLWEPVGKLAAFLFWDLPERLTSGAGWAGLVVGLALAAALIATLCLPRYRRTRPLTAMVAVGVITGIAVAFIPIVLAIPISPEHFESITWFRSWI